MTQISRPTFVVDKYICLANIERMAQKAIRHNVKFRPHFKTHQSAEIGNWFRDFGVNSITVSSVQMARYFAENGWTDISLAFPFNLLEMGEINQLASKLKLNLLLENTEGAAFLSKNSLHQVGVFLKIDTGYHRTGIDAADFEKIDSILTVISSNRKLEFKGFLSHTGHTYQARNSKEIESRHLDALLKLRSLKKRYQTEFPNVEISTGDTPSSSVCENFEGVDEIRPGNFLFYDLTQESIGSCKMEHIAVKMVCPVVARHLSRNEILIYGGAVHFSKDYLIDKNNNKSFGRIVIRKNGEKQLLDSGNHLAKLSQEHGTLKIETRHFKDFEVGDLVEILPVHSCLTADVMGWMQTTDGMQIKMMPRY